MADSTGGSLNAAYEAIKAKDLAKARDVLSAYLVDNPNDADAWWLYSYAVMDVEQGRKALQTVLRLDPSYPGARDLLSELESVSPAPPAPPAEVAAAPGIKPITRTGEAPKMTTIEPDDETDAEFGFADETEQKSGRFGRLLIAAIAAAIVIVVVLVAFILPNLNRPQEIASGTQEPTTTSIAFGATDEPTGAPTEETAGATDATEPTVDPSGAATDSPTAALEVTDVPTEDTSTDEAPTTEAVPTDVAVAPTDVAVAPTEPTDDTTLQLVYDALVSYQIVQDSAGIETTELGETLSVTVCAVSSELRSVLPAVLSSLAAISPQLPSETQAVGARFVNCTDNQELRFVALDMADAQAYAAGSLTDAELRSRFVPLQ